MVEQNLMGNVELSVSGYKQEPVYGCWIFGVFLILGIVGAKEGVLLCL